MNILILTGKFGMGHWSASQSLRQRLLRAFPDARVEVEDFFAYAMPDASDALYKGFSLLVTLGSYFLPVSPVIFVLLTALIGIAAKNWGVKK